VGYQLFHDPRYLFVMRGRQRPLEALLWGAPSLPEGKPIDLASEMLPVAGVATLRVKGSDHTVAVKFGPHGGGHGHYDKLTFISYANGAHLAADPGTQAYGAKSHNTWDKMTVAHNTVSVDQAVQKPATGKLISWQAEPEFTAVVADAGPVYDNVDLQRTSIVTSDYVLEITTASSTDGKEHDFDWNYHNFGVQHADGNFSPYAGFPQKDGYNNLTENQSATIAGDFHSAFVMDNNRQMDMWMLGEDGESQVFTGLGPGPDLRVKVPYAIVRRHGTSAEFIAVLLPGPVGAKTLNVTKDASGIHIKSSEWEDTIEPRTKVTYRRVRRQ